MSLFTKQLIINKFVFPTEIIDYIKEYAFIKIKKIPKNDIRYIILSTIQLKTGYMLFDNITITYEVLLKISEKKHYYLTYINNSVRTYVI